MGFAFPKEWRDALVEAEPEKFSLPSRSDLRYHRVHVRLAAIDADECAISSRTSGHSACRNVLGFQELAAAQVAPARRRPLAASARATAA
jgi:hypothetical protein